MFPIALLRGSLQCIRIEFRSGLKLAFNSCLHAKLLGLRIDDKRKMAGILNFKDGDHGGKNAWIRFLVSSPGRTFHSRMKSPDTIAVANLAHVFP